MLGIHLESTVEVKKQLYMLPYQQHVTISYKLYYYAFIHVAKLIIS